MSSSRSFIVSGLMFRSLIHFEFIFVNGIRKCSSFIPLQEVDQFSQHHLLKRLSFLPCFCLYFEKSQIALEGGKECGEGCFHINAQALTPSSVVYLSLNSSHRPSPDSPKKGLAAFSFRGGLGVHHGPNCSIVAVQSLSCVQLCDPKNCSKPGFPILHSLPVLAQTHVH